MAVEMIHYISKLATVHDCAYCTVLVLYCTVPAVPTVYGLEIKTCMFTDEVAVISEEI